MAMSVQAEPVKAADSVKLQEEEKKIEKIGIIFVHGIGEQRRFSHLDGEMRPLIDALLRRPAQTTIEISAGTHATLHADQDTWSTQEGAPVRAIVKEAAKGRQVVNGKEVETGKWTERQLFFHEVWWADVNEPYTFEKQWRFWLWGLAMWNIPLQKKPKLPPDYMKQASFPEGTLAKPAEKGDERTVRVQLFLVSNLFLMGAFSVGAIVFLTRRILGYAAPDFVRIFENYLSAVRIYTQTERAGGGFLDAFREAPRASIRRRMVRTMIDVVQQKYDRWYIFAHSLGSVVAFNGVMENAQAMANYLDEKRWKELVEAGIAGSAYDKNEYVGPTGNMLPARPLWLAHDDVVHRDKLLAKFAGLVTYGSPLDKFAMLWPSQVPINVGEKIFFDSNPNLPLGEKPATEITAEWINVYDPTDPVAASLEAFDPRADWQGVQTAPPAGSADTGKLLLPGVLAPKNYGYCADWKLLVSHLHYLDVHKDNSADTSKYRVKPNELSDALMAWVLSGRPFEPQRAKVDRWFEPGSPTHKLRTLSRKVSYWIVYAILTFLAAVSLPLILSVIGEVAKKAYQLSPALPEMISRPISLFFGAIKDFVLGCSEIFSAFGDGLQTLLLNWYYPKVAVRFIPDYAVPFVLEHTSVQLVLGVAAITWIAGRIGHRFVFEDLDQKKDEPNLPERGRSKIAVT
jgi:hypothetical protein